MPYAHLSHGDLVCSNEVVVAEILGSLLADELLRPLDLRSGGLVDRSHPLSLAGGILRDCLQERKQCVSIQICMFL